MFTANSVMVYIGQRSIRGETFNKTSKRPVRRARARFVLGIDPKTDGVPRPFPGQEAEEAADDAVQCARPASSSSSTMIPPRDTSQTQRVGKDAASENNTEEEAYGVGANGSNSKYSATALAARRSGRFRFLFVLASLVPTFVLALFGPCRFLLFEPLFPRLLLSSCSQRI